jgi:hypothetical protein
LGLLSACDNGNSPSGKDPGGKVPGETLVSVTGVTLDQRNITLPEGGTSTLKATVTPGNAANKNVTWSSSNETKATVSGGVVKAVAAGTAIITVTTADGGKTATCTVTVTPVPVSIEVTNPPDKTVYKTGENLDLTGLGVRATYTDGSNGMITVNTSHISGFDNTQARVQELTVTYGGKTAKFTVTVLALAKIKITKSPEIVAVGEPFDVEALEVEATWGDDSTDKYIKERVEITPAHISGFNKDNTGIQTVTVTYEGKTATFDVLVLSVDGIIIDTMPTKTLYRYGEELELDGLVVKAVFSDGDGEIEHSALNISGFNSWSSGEQLIIVSYGDEYATFTVTVIAVTKAEITSPPTKTLYKAGEELDIDGLVVKITFSDGEEREVEHSALVIWGFASSVAGEQTITVYYGYEAPTFTVTVIAVTKLEIISPPIKTRYLPGEPLDITGLEVEVTWGDDGTDTSIRSEERRVGKECKSEWRSRW